MRALHLRYVRIGVAALLGSVLLGIAAPAHAADYRLWYQHAQEKVYRTTLAPSSAVLASAPETQTRTLYLSAARGEYEGKQVVIRPVDAGVREFWIRPTELVGTDASGSVVGTIGPAAVECFKVAYVNITRPSTGYTRRGLQPDPLIPMTLANGRRLGWMPGGGVSYTYRQTNANVTQPYYVLFKVSDETTPGVYRGSLILTASGTDGSSVPTVSVPVRLEVYRFSIARRTLKTSFGLGLNWARYANAPTHNWLPVDTNPTEDRVYERDSLQFDQLSGWFKYFAEHRISPQTSMPAWYRSSGPPGASGTMTPRTKYLKDYFWTGASPARPGQAAFGFDTIRMPEAQWRPAFISNPFASVSDMEKASSYYASMYSALGPDASKAYVYVVDEPPSTYKSFIEHYAALVHSAAPGVKFLLTTDGNKWGYQPLMGVDIYVQRLQYYYKEYWKWITPLRRSGKSVWIYSHATSLQSQVPMFILDKPLGEVRAMGYFAYHTCAGGLLYYNVNRWCVSSNIGTYRDPYVNTLSYQAGTTTYANGDGSLVYPGYYPAQGLYVQGAGPVGSLRMEALRDGIEDYEYLRQVKGKYGAAAASSAVGKILGPKITVYVAGRPTFPYYYKGSYRYEVNHRAMAASLQ